MPVFVSSYVVEIQSPPNSNAPWTTVHTKSISSISAADISSDSLAAFTLYGVRVVAMYMDGTRVPSEEGTVQTGTDAPADSPKGLIGTAPNNNALALSWNVSWHNISIATSASVMENYAKRKGSRR